MIKRYDQEGFVEPCEDGCYVLYTDYEILEKQLVEAIIAENKRVRKLETALENIIIHSKTIGGYKVMNVIRPIPMMAEEALRENN